MIANPNKGNFYSEKEMEHRKNSIASIKAEVLEKINDIRQKIDTEEPFPHGDISLDFLVETSDKLDEILNNWYY